MIKTRFYQNHRTFHFKHNQNNGAVEEARDSALYFRRSAQAARKFDIACKIVKSIVG